MCSSSASQVHLDRAIPDNPIAKSLGDVARVHLAGLGTRIFYTQHGGYDTHASEVPTHPRLVGELSGALKAFMRPGRAQCCR